MNEQERVAFYQEHKDDPEIWDEPESRDEPRPRRTLSVTVTVRFSPAEAQTIRQLAEARGASYSDIVRAAVRAYADPRPVMVQRNLTVLYGPGVGPTSADRRVYPGEGFREGAEPTTLSLAASG